MKYTASVYGLMTMASEIMSALLCGMAMGEGAVREKQG